MFMGIFMTFKKSHVILYKGTALYGCKTNGWWLQFSTFYEMAAIKIYDYLWTQNPKHL